MLALGWWAFLLYFRIPLKQGPKALLDHRHRWRTGRFLSLMMVLTH
ncbi:hypothetical protein H2136_16400 [Aeromonas hydrophila]|uniref:Uncharacterized protein n=1 Tax=Aeromonas hydrophila TaxID=644 RepID=A0A926FP02_AERHY|nr:hypothetical protein [Aeromonas hydrophila]